MSGGLEIDGLAVPRGDASVLDGLDLQVPAGTRTALVGPSGAGKTTLLRAIAGLQEPTAGDIRLDGRSLRGVPAHRRRVAVVFQEPRLLAHLDVAENVALPLRAAGVAKGDRLRRASGLLEEVGLAAFARRRVTDLSGGEQQRVGLARALCAEPAALLLDEPLAAVDAGRREELRRLLAAVQEDRGVTFLLVTHDRAEAAELGERIALLLGGRIAQAGTPADLFERPATVDVARFLGTANVLSGTVCDGRLRLDGIRDALPVTGPDGPATFVIRPEHIRPARSGAITAQVVEAVYTGTAIRLLLQAGGLSLTAAVSTGEAPPVGASATFDLPASRLWRIPAVSR